GPDCQLLQSFGQRFELLVCAEFVESVDADLNRSGVVIGYIVDVFGFAHDHLCRRVVPHQALIALHLAARMSLLARLRMSDCEVVHTLLLKYEASHQRQKANAAPAEGVVQTDLALTHGVSQATISRLAAPSLSSTSRSSCDARQTLAGGRRLATRCLRRERPCHRTPHLKANASLASHVSYTSASRPAPITSFFFARLFRIVGAQ